MGNRFVLRQMISYREGFVSIAYEQSQPDDRDVRVGSGRRRRPLRRCDMLVRGFGPFLEQQVGVVAAEAEVVDRGAARSDTMPGFGFGEQPERRVSEIRQRIVGVQGRRPYSRPHRREHFDGSGSARCRDGVPEIDFNDPIGTLVIPSKMRAMLISSVRSPRAVPVA